MNGRLGSSVVHLIAKSRRARASGATLLKQPKGDGISEVVFPSEALGCGRGFDSRRLHFASGAKGTAARWPHVSGSTGYRQLALSQSRELDPTTGRTRWAS